MRTPTNYPVRNAKSTRIGAAAKTPEERRSRNQARLFRVMALLLLGVSCTFMAHRVWKLAEKATADAARAQGFGLLHLARLTDWAAEVSSDPRRAIDLCDEAQQFGAFNQFNTKRVDDIRAGMPERMLLPAESRVHVREVRSMPPSLVVEISITDKDGQFVNGLSRIDFEVCNDGHRIATVQTAEVSRPFAQQSIAILVDCSKSMSGDRLQAAVNAASQFSANVANPARVQLWEFSDTARARTPWTWDSEVISEELQKMTADKGTALYDAIRSVALSLGQRNTARCIVLLSDGENSNKDLTPDATITECQQLNVQIHVVALATDSNAEVILRSMATSTGGSFQSASESAQLAERFRQIAEQLTERVYRIVIPQTVDQRQSLTLQVGNLPEITLRATDKNTDQPEPN